MSTIRATYVQHGSSPVPNITLDASGNVTVASGLAFNSSLSIPSGSVSAPGLSFVSDTDTGFYSATPNTIAIATNGTAAITVDASQRVGLGTSSPARQFTVYDSSTPIIQLVNSTTGQTANDGVMLYESSSNFVIENQEAGEIQIYNNGSQRVTIDSSGNVGVGTTPARTLDVAGEVQLCTGLAAGVVNIKGSSYSQMFADNTFYIESAAASGQIVFRRNGGSNESCRIDGSGRLLVGTSTGHAANRNAFENATTGQISFRHSSTTAGHHNLVGMNSGSAFVVTDSSGTTGVQLAYSGTSWSTLSDERHKTDLTPIDDGLAKVGTLRAVTGRLIGDPDTKSRSFLIAQDVQAVLPQAVDTTDPDALALSYTEVIPLLVAALKESKERIEQLEAKVAALESA